MLVLLGFPITLVIAWAFELTPEGLKKSSSVESHLNLSRHRPETD
jgi:hypothetical protein